MECEKRFVHFRWSDELAGKEVFYADNIATLTNDVTNDGEKGIVTFSECEDEPFSIRHFGVRHSWRFVYYDPNYEVKLAYEQGKKIECRRKWAVLEDWDYTPDPKWLDDYEYRIKPDEPEESKHITKRELARWLAQGNGEWSYRSGDMVNSNYVYSKGEKDNPITEETIRIRKWDDDEWHKPTREYMGL